MKKVRTGTLCALFLCACTPNEQPPAEALELPGPDAGAVVSDAGSAPDDAGALPGTPRQGEELAWPEEAEQCLHQQGPFAYIFHPGYPGSEYALDPIVGLVAGKRHLLVMFELDATQCEILASVAAVDGRLVSWLSILQAGLVEFDWEENPEALHTACTALNDDPVVSVASYDLLLEPL